MVVPESYKLSFNEKRMKEIFEYHSKSFPCDVKRDVCILAYLEYILFLRALAIKSKEEASKYRCEIKVEHILSVGEDLLMKFVR